MKKTMALLFSLIFIISAISACGAPPEESSTPFEPEVSSVAPSPSPSPTPTPTPTVSEEPKNLSLTTGLPIKEDREYKPVTVMIENSAGSRPQTGLNQADIVYEAMAESSITRFMCVFNDTYPEVVGPVRSTRLYYIRLQKEWDSPLVHFGGPSSPSRPSYVYGKAASHIKVRIDGIKGASSKYFWRDKSRKAPHNAYTNVQKIVDKAYDYTPKVRTPFKFDENVSYEGETVSRINMPFSSDSKSFINYRYDADSDKFIRYMGNKEFKTYQVGEDKKSDVVKVQNIIVQYAKTYVLKNDVKGRKMVDVTGSGKAEYFIGGKHLKGKWVRKDLNKDTQFLLEDGSELVLKPGNTWIELHPNNKKIEVK